MKKPLPAKTAQRDYLFELELDQFLHDELLDIDLPELGLSAVDLFLPDEDLELPAFDTKSSILELSDKAPEIDISFDTEELCTLDATLPEPDLNLPPLDLEQSLAELPCFDADLTQFCAGGCSRVKVRLPERAPATPHVYRARAFHVPLVRAGRRR